MDAAQIHALIHALHQAELLGSVDAALRLERVLRPLSDAPAQRLHGAIHAVVLKSKKPETREALQRVLDSWQGARARHIALEPVRPVPPPTTEAAPPRHAGILALLLLLLGAGLALTYYAMQPPAVADAGPPEAGLPDASPPDAGVTDAGAPIESYPFPTITTQAQPPSTTTRWPDALLGLLALIGVGIIWRFRGVFEGPPATTAPSDDRPPLPPQPVDRVIDLLDLNEARDLEWGVERYLSDEHLSRLDVRATVDATARAGGQPTLRYQRAHRHREVWLWCDRGAVQRHPEVQQLSDDIIRVLRRAGLPVERAWFWGLPDTLTDDDGVVVPRERVEDRRGFAHIALLTDGHLMNAWADDAEVHARLAADLRNLSHWPHFALVDFSAHQQGLGARAQQHDLTLLAPHELAAWLAGTSHQPPATLTHTIEQWIAACALCVDPVADSTALALRDALQLPAPNWALGALRKRNQGPGGRLLLEPAARRASLSWLAHAERGPGCTLERARAFWIAHYAQAQAPADSRAQRWFGVAAHLIGLWSPDPSAVAAAVRGLYRERETFEAAIERELAGYGPSDTASTTVARLPWAWSALDTHPEIQRMLTDLGLGGLAPQPSAALERGRRIQFAMAACAAVALVFGAAWWQAAPVASTAVHRIIDAPNEGARPSDGLIEPHQVGLRRQVEAVTPERGTETVVNWQRTTPRPCVEQRGDTTTWRCGTQPRPIRGPGAWPGRSRFVLTFSVERGRRLALRLLDTGVADVVVFTPDASAIQAQPGEQLVVVTHSPSIPANGRTLVITDDLDALARTLGYGTPVPLKSAWGALAQVSGAPALLSDGACVAGQRKTVRGVEFVQLCGGAFKMGSDSDKANDDEQPVHTVRLTPYWIARSETTVAAYTQCHEAGACESNEAELTESTRCNFGERPTHPMNCVDWAESAAFCGWLGGALPTEAQWAFAARGSAVRTYPWGSAEPTCALANYDKCKPSGTSPVCDPKQRGGETPEGLCNLAGNVWEWSADCYHDDTYQKRAGSTLTNPRLEACEPAKDGRWGRVLRGGSFADAARFLRSADRRRGPPSGRIAVIGFRCVLGPRPQQP